MPPLFYFWRNYMFELTINDKVFSFNFGIGFVREINKTVQVEQYGVKEDAGLTMALTRVYDGNAVALPEPGRKGNVPTQPGTRGETTVRSGVPLHGRYGFPWPVRLL